MDTEMKNIDRYCGSVMYRYLLIVLLILLAYGNTLNHGFVWDDFDIIVENPTLNLRNIPRFFVTEDKISAPTGYYRPITYLSFAIDRTIWGTNPLGFNITNLLLHVLVSLLFYRVVAALFKRENLALVAALVFALHPIVGETINFHAGGRNTLLCSVFTLASLFFYIRREGTPAIICFTLGIFSKEFALLLPAILFLYDRTLNEKKTTWRAYLPYAIASAVYLLMRSLVVKANANLIQAANIADNFWIVPQTIVAYLRNMALPFYLKTLYYVNLQVTWSGFLTCSFIIALLLAVAFVFRKKREILFAVAIFLLFLLPVTNIFNLGAAMVTDRHAYLATLGFSLGLAWVICSAKKQVAVPVTIALCALFGVMDVVKNRVWKDEITLFSQMVKDAPELSSGPYQNLGVIYFNRRDFSTAEKYLLLSLDKGGIGHADATLDSFMRMFVEMDLPDKAVLVLNQKIKKNPKNPEPHFVLSRIYEATGQGRLARAHLDKAELLSPGAAEAMRNKVVEACRQGEAFMSRRKFVRAESLFDGALTMDPYSVPALIDMGGVMVEKGEMDKALRYFVRAAALAPQDPTPHFNLSMAYSAMGREAEAQAEQARYKELLQRSGISAPQL